MIYYFAMADNFAPMRNYLNQWARWLHRHMLVVACENLSTAPSFPDGTFLAEQIRIREVFARRLNRVFLALDDRSPSGRSLWGRLVMCLDRLR